MREDLIQFATLQINAIAAAAAAGELRSGDEFAEDEAAEDSENEDVVIRTPVVDEETTARFYEYLRKGDKSSNGSSAFPLESMFLENSTFSKEIFQFCYKI